MVKCDLKIKVERVRRGEEGKKVEWRELDEERGTEIGPDHPQRKNPVFATVKGASTTGVDLPNVLGGGMQLPMLLLLDKAYPPQRSGAGPVDATVCSN